MAKKTKRHEQGSLKVPSVIQDFTTVVTPEVLWQEEPSEHDYPAAESFLSLITTPAIARKLVKRLQDAPVVRHPAKDILRAARLELLDMSDPSVKRDITDVIEGRKLSPVLLVRGDSSTDTALIVADGYHRVCAGYHLSENELIPCRLIDA